MKWLDMNAIRRLELKDAEGMLEWMHDCDVNKYFQYPFAQSTLDSVNQFINNSFNDENQHFAIVNEKDEYCGTVSLKNISYTNGNAEYAIVLRKCAQGMGIAHKATEEILQYAFRQLKLHKVYLNVLSENIRARRLYEKCGFLLEGLAKDAVQINGSYYDLAWYSVVGKQDVR